MSLFITLLNAKIEGQEKTLATCFSRLAQGLAVRPSTSRLHAVLYIIPPYLNKSIGVTHESEIL